MLPLGNDLSEAIQQIDFNLVAGFRLLKQVLPIANGKPRVVDGVLTKAYVYIALPEFLHAGHAPAFGVGVLPPLEVGAFSWQGNKVQSGLLEQSHHAKRIGAVCRRQDLNLRPSSSEGTISDRGLGLVGLKRPRSKSKTCSAKTYLAVAIATCGFGRLAPV